MILRHSRSQRLGCFSFLLVVWWAFTAWAAADQPGTAETVTVGIYQNAPKVFTTEDGRPAGIFVDIIENIAEREGWTLRYLPGTWAEGLERLKKGEIDLMPDVALTPERTKAYAFHSVPVLSSWSQVYARKGSGIQSILDLNGKRVLVLDGSVQQATFANFVGGFGLNIVLAPMPDYQTMFTAVAKGEADAAITNRFYGMTHAARVGLEDTAVIFDPSDLFFATGRLDPKRLNEAIDRHLAGLKKDSGSVYYTSLKRWTSEHIDFAWPLWLKIVGTGGLGFLFMSLVGSLILKHQVNARTSELRLINQEMEQRISERTAELAAVNKELRVALENAQAADRIKSAFLATMSHELRTPLNSIIGFTGIMLQGLAGPLNDEQQKQMGMVQNSSRHLLALINDVLDISKIEAGQLELACTSFDLRASLKKVSKTVTPLAEQKKIELTLSIGDDVAEITTDQRRFEQVVLNLLSNAIKFTDRGRVEVSCASDGNCYRLTFTDTGIGMREEEISTIFKPFHQIDTGLARTREGTGLGLSICRKILDLMGGTIGVTSTIGQGSTFTVRIPRQPGVKP